MLVDTSLAQKFTTDESSIHFRLQVPMRSRRYAKQTASCGSRPGTACMIVCENTALDHRNLWDGGTMFLLFI